ncbi:MAG: membrane protein insertase YidC, partial [Gammaproteobacteria bacterium]
MDENNRNFIMAIILSIAVLLSWQYFYNGPKTKEREALKQQQAQQEKVAKPGQAAPSTAPPPSVADGAPPKPSSVPSPLTAGVPSSAPTPLGTGRKAALAKSERLSVETPKLKGSISLNGARIDDLVLTRY